MRKQFNRRLFIQNTILASIACSFFPAAAIKADKTEQHISSSISNLETGRVNKKEIMITGSIYDKTGVEKRNDVFMEVWHLSASSNTKEHFKRIQPNEAGEYQFVTKFPGKTIGKLPQLHFKIIAKERSYKTELSVNAYGAYISDKHWENNRQLGDNVFPNFIRNKNRDQVEFNLSV